MSNETLQDLLLLQSRITTIILAFVAIVMAGIVFDLGIHLYKKYIKKGVKK